jgi:hypothetical protein
VHALSAKNKVRFHMRNNYGFLESDTSSRRLIIYDYASLKAVAPPFMCGQLTVSYNF